MIVNPGMRRALRNQPSMGINFLAGENLDSRITFTRASSKTYFNSSGTLATAATNEAPREYDPSTLACRGRSFWEARTNLVFRSGEFDNAYWVKTRSSITANAAVAPDGTTTMDKLVEDSTATNSHPVASTAVTLAANTTSSYSVFLKAGERTAAVIRVAAGADSIWGSFNLATGAVGVTAVSGTGTGASISIQDVGGGIYRCTLSGIHSTTTANPIVIVYPAVSTGDPTNTSILYTGNGTSGIYIWGAQIEAGATPTPYIPTTTASVTRAADVCSMTGTNFSSWWSAIEGTFVTVGFTTGVAAARTFVSANAAAETDFISLGIDSSANPIASVTTGSAPQASIDCGTATANTVGTFAMAYKLNDIAASWNGGTVGTDTTATLPTVTQLSIGKNSTTTATLNGYIQRISYWNRRLSDATLRSLST